jgi:hypothetical protein
MQTGVRFPRRRASFCKVEFSSSAPARSARDKGLHALLRAAIPRTVLRTAFLRIFLRTPRPVIDLLLGCFLLVIGLDKSPGIAVSTIPELSAALMREDADGAYGGSSNCWPRD